MKKASTITLIVAAVIAVLLVYDGFFVVDETEQVVVTQFGRAVDTYTEPGLKMKIPFIQSTHYFERRYLEWDGDRNQVPTKQKKYIFVDTYARWRITDPLQFYKRLGNERSAQSRLDDILDGQTRDAVASNDLVEIVRTTNREPVSEGAILEVVEDTLEDINVGRDSIQTSIENTANIQARELGIEVMDFRFKRINYVENVRKTVYDRMISERNRIADKFRSEGQGEASRINGEKQRELQTIRSEAFRRAEEIKGEADAKAASIYAQAYNKSPQARELYRFTKSMETFEKTMDEKTSVFLSTDSDFFRYLKTID